jgi:hypothetical protein
MSSVVTVETAPRDLEGLSVLGRFNLRNLADKLGGFPTEEAKVAFMAGTNDAQAQTVAVLLKKYDEASGKGGKAAATTEKQPPRTPVNGKAKATDKAEAAPADAVTPMVGAAQLLEAMNRLNATMETFNERLESLEVNTNELAAIARGGNRLRMIGLNLNLMLAEEVLKAPRDEVLKAAVDDVGGVIKLIESLDPSLTANGAEEEEEEEEAGN